MSTREANQSGMKFVSTKNSSEPCSFSDAMANGLAPDGGLYLPETYPVLPENFWNGIEQFTLREISYRLAEPYFDTEDQKKLIFDVIQEAINFDAPLIHLKDNHYILELFHGPTLAFKDFGARFMARAYAAMHKQNEGDLTILVATSGDTGSAVAHGFYGVEGTQVCLLYPSGKVSPLQEKQMTTLGKNITALEVDGTFDDCQRLVKQAFNDSELRSKKNVSSANSINIARLLPQSFYYAYGLAQLRHKFQKMQSPVFSVPSGNFGNLTGGLIAMQMGMPVSRFLAATNRNDIVPSFLQIGLFDPKPSVKTISNAMDVGNPSNFERILDIFDGSVDRIRKSIWGKSFNDDQTRQCIKDIFNDTGYIMDPHTSVGLLAAESYLEDTGDDCPVITLSTAHPAKFGDIVEKEIGQPVPVPDRLKECMDKKKQSIRVKKDYDSFRNYLLSNR
jgi:threonine synthase